MSQTIEQTLAAIVQVRENDHGLQGSLTFPDLFQGFPEAAHGGGLVAAFDDVARRSGVDAGPRRLSARIERSVRLDHPLAVTANRHGEIIQVSVCDGGDLSARADISSLPHSETSNTLHREWSTRSGARSDAPVTRGCLACGFENPLGAQLRFGFDPVWLWSEHQPREPFRLADGRLAPALFPILLDEIGWWLGALRTGEAGVTTEVDVTLHRPTAAFNELLIVAGKRAAVAPTDRRERVWEVDAEVWNARDGALLASAKITYAVIRAYTRRLIPALRAINSTESVRQVFPQYVP